MGHEVVTVHDWAPSGESYVFWHAMSLRALRMNAAQFPTYGQDSDSLRGAATSETRLAPRNSRFVEALRVMIFMHM